jgi:hypothetical protein
MASDIKKKIDAHIRRLEELKRFLDDPATEPFIEQLFSSSGMTAKQTVQLPLVQSTPKGGLLGSVADVCRAMTTQEFSSREVIERLEILGYKFHAKNKAVAINSALKRLVKRGTIQLVQAASGQRPAIYKIPERFSREMKGTAA